MRSDSGIRNEHNVCGLIDRKSTTQFTPFTCWSDRTTALCVVPNVLRSSSSSTKRKRPTLFARLARALRILGSLQVHLLEQLRL